MPKLTKRMVDAIRPGEAESFVWDDEPPGFGLRVLPSGRRSYLIQYRAKGRTRRLVLGPHGVLTPELARDKAIRLLADVRGGADPSAERKAERTRPTVAELAKRYLSEHAEPKKKPSSAASDRRLLDKKILPALGHVRVADVTRAEVTRLHHQLRKVPIEANRMLALLSKMMNLAERWGLRPDGSNPCRHVERYRERKVERFLSPAELARLGEALADMERERSETASVVAAVRLLAFTGARRGEILRLRWEHVDLAAACLRLPDSKTGAKTIRLNAPARQVLAGLEHRSEWVLPTADGREPVSLSQPWGRIRTRAKLDDVRIHDLRHAFASIGVSAGAALYVIGGLLGHTQAATTQRYAHLSDDPLRAASEVIGARLAAAMAGGDGAEVIPLAPGTR
jgi:integrase